MLLFILMRMMLFIFCKFLFCILKAKKKLDDNKEERKINAVYLCSSSLIKELSERLACYRQETCQESSRSDQKAPKACALCSLMGHKEGNCLLRRH